MKKIGNYILILLSLFIIGVLVYTKIFYEDPYKKLVNSYLNNPTYKCNNKKCSKLETEIIDEIEFKINKIFDYENGVYTTNIKYDDIKYTSNYYIKETEYSNSNNMIISYENDKYNFKGTFLPSNEILKINQFPYSEDNLKSTSVEYISIYEEINGLSKLSLNLMTDEINNILN